MNTTDQNKELVSTLNDLVKINNDRIEGYKKAAEQAKENPVLQVMFQEKAADSQKFVSELNQHIAKTGGEPTNDTTVAGKVFRSWMDVKNTFKPSDKTTILDSCEFGEDAALKAYDMALKSDAELEAELRKTIITQQESIKASHDRIKLQRDLSANLDKTT
jgi:uncharacterized protein (TIGR02284 family)